VTDIYDLGAFFGALESLGFKPADFGTEYLDDSLLNLNIFQLESIARTQIALEELEDCATNQELCQAITTKFINNFQETKRCQTTSPPAPVTNSSS